MVHICSFCGVQWNAKNQRKFHGFPLSNSDKLKKWISQLDQDTIDKINFSSRLCSDHFQQECFKEGKHYEILKDDAVPSIFGDRKSRCVFCNEKRNRDTKRALHKFPFGNQEILNKWIINIPKQNFQPTETSTLCSDHFEEHCFEKNGYLKRKSVPTIFKENDAEGLSPALSGRELFLKRRNLDSKCQSNNLENSLVRIDSQCDVQGTARYSFNTSRRQGNIGNLTNLGLQESLPKHRKINNIEHDRHNSETFLNPEDNRVSSDSNFDKVNHSASVGTGNLSKNVIPQNMEDHEENTSSAGMLKSLARRNRNVTQDHCYDYSPHKRKKKLWETREQLSKRSRKLKTQNQHIKRLSNRISNLKAIVNASKTTNSTPNEVIKKDYNVTGKNVDPFEDIVAVKSEYTSSDVSNISFDGEVSSSVLENDADQDENFPDAKGSSNPKSLSIKLATWAVTFGISTRCIEVLMKILREEEIYVPATATKLMTLNNISNTRRLIDDQEETTASKLIFFEEAENQKNVFLTRFSNSHAKPCNLKKGIQFMKPYIESDVKKNITDNLKKLIKTIRNYPSIYSSNTPDCTNSTVWKKVARDMSWRVQHCIALWKKIKDQFKERIARKTFDKDWKFRDDLLFLKFSIIFKEFSVDNLPRISEDVDLNLFLNEIKKYPCLYDLNLKVANRKIIWDIIGKPLNLSGKECKKYWGILSSIYIDYMDRKSKEVSNAKLSKFEIEMEFFKPFCKNLIVHDAKAIKESINSIENISTPKNWSLSFSEGNDRLRKHVTNYRISLDSKSSNNDPEDNFIDKSEADCEDEYILSDCPPSSVRKNLEDIANALVDRNPNAGDDCFTITKLCYDSE